MWRCCVDVSVVCIEVDFQSEPDIGVLVRYAFWHLFLSPFQSALCRSLGNSFCLSAPAPVLMHDVVTICYMQAVFVPQLEC